MAISFPSTPSVNQVYSSGSKTWIWNGYAWDLSVSNTSTLIALTTPVVLNDISQQFDGFKCVFDLRLEQDNINTIVDSKDLEVVVNGSRLIPYVDKYTYPWLTTYTSFNGYKVISIPSDTNASVNVGKVIIYNSPFIGDSSSLIYRPVTQSKQKRKYPFEATTIALGD